MQHHAILRTTLTLHSPQGVPSVESLDIPLELHVHLKQASYFTLRPMNYKISSFHPVWYAGNIYDLERTLPQIVPLSVTNSAPGPIQFDLFVSGDYEVSSGFPFELLYLLMLRRLLDQTLRRPTRPKL